MIHKEAWHREADDRRRLEELLQTVRKGRSDNWEETYQELAQLVRRMGLKEVPEMPGMHRRMVFMYMYPSFMDYLRGVVREVTRRSVQEMQPYWKHHDSITSHIFSILEIVEHLTDAWEAEGYSRNPLLQKMRELEQELEEWDVSIGDRPLPPREITYLPEGVRSGPFITLQEIEKGDHHRPIYLPSWLKRVIPRSQG